jgi:hypothetical protein
MKKLFKRSVIIFSCAAIIFSLCSWGFYVHETTTQLAVYQLPGCMRKFFFANIDTLTHNAIRPDQRRYMDKTESAKHFIDLEAFGDSAAYTMPRDYAAAIQKYSSDTLKKYGFVPYQVLIEYDSLVNAFRHTNVDSIIFYADDLAHYIEDANVPLHTAINYNGQLTNQKGIHALWESTIPEIELGNYNLRSKHKATYVKDKQALVWDAVEQAHALLPEMFEKEKEVAKNFPGDSKYVEKMYYGRMTKVYTDEFAKQYAAVLGPSVNNQLIHSANMVADFWYSAWVDAGKPNLKHLSALNRAGKKKLRREMRANRKNELLKDGFLRARKE